MPSNLVLSDCCRSGGDTLTTVLFDAQQTVIAQMSFTAADPGVFDAASNYLFEALADPLRLPAGQYTLVAYGFSAVNPVHNSGYDGLRPTFNGGGIRFVHSVWTTTGLDPAGTWPTLTWGPGSPNLFDGPNLIYQVPSPGAVLLGGIGVVLLGYLRGRRVL